MLPDRSERLLEGNKENAPKRVTVPVMKLPLLPAVVWVAAIPLVVMADGRREHPMPVEVDGHITVLPIAMESGETRSALSLRESLRQPFDDASDDHPFRLNAQERQRMRDQLRAQPFKSAAKQ